LFSSSAVGTVIPSQAVFTSSLEIGPGVTQNEVVVTLDLDVATQVAFSYILTWIDGTQYGKILI